MGGSGLLLKHDAPTSPHPKRHLNQSSRFSAGVVISLERGADLHMAQPMPLPLTVSCFSKIQTGFTFLVPAHPGSPGKGAVKRVRVRVCVVEELWQCDAAKTQGKKYTHAHIHLTALCPGLPG